MVLNLSEEEAHMLILKALNLEGDATLRTRGDLHILQSHHTINIAHKPKPVEEVPDDCFVVDGILDDGIAQIEEHLDGT